MDNLIEDVGQFTPEKLILDPTYPQQIGSGIFATQAEPTIIKRGCLLAKNEAGKLVLATAEEKDSLSICLKDTIVHEDTVVEVLLAGAVSAGGVIVDGADVYDFKDDLRKNNIYIKSTIGGN